MKTLEEFKERYPEQWGISTGNRILIALFFQDKGLKKDRLIELTGLDDPFFSECLAHLQENREITFNETSKERFYSLEQKTRDALENFYNKEEVQ